MGDIRHVAFGDRHDLAMILYAEFNVFAPHEAGAILARARASLTPQGRMLIETHPPEAVEAIGRDEPSEQQLESGLFSDRPHLYRTENRWLSDHNVAVQTFTITDTETGRQQVYRSTTKAWSDEELSAAVRSAGFSDMARCTDWPCNTDSLTLWIAER